MKNTRGFTLIEALVSVVLTAMILVTGYSAFQGIMATQIKLTGAIDIQGELFYFNEKITALIREGGTLDYEEYFNRRMIDNGSYIRDGVDTDSDGVIDTGTYRTSSRFGNTETLYACHVNSADEESCLGTVKPDPNPNNVSSTSLTGQQKYGQYAHLAFNYENSLGYPLPSKLPPILTADHNKGLPELYLIKKLSNGSFERTFFRHVFVAYPNTPCEYTTGEGCMGKLQMTKLVSCDTLTGDTLVADGTIDAWVPHDKFGGTATDPCSTIKSQTDIEEAADNLVWIDISSPNTDVVEATFLPSPLKIPSLMSGSGEEAQAPSIQMRLEVSLSQLRGKKIFAAAGDDTRLLMTTLHLHE